MCCFIAPLATSVITSATSIGAPKSYRLGFLNTMLWGGSVMLVIDHVINGEVRLSFPFFTKSFSAMLPEIIHVGVPMTLAIFAVWGGALVWDVLKARRTVAVA